MRERERERCLNEQMHLQSPRHFHHGISIGSDRRSPVSRISLSLIAPNCVASLFGFNLPCCLNEWSAVAIIPKRRSIIGTKVNDKRSARSDTVPESPSSRGRTRMGTVSRSSWSMYRSTRLNVTRGRRDTLSTSKLPFSPFFLFSSFFQYINFYSLSVVT